MSNLKLGTRLKFDVKRRRKHLKFSDLESEVKHTEEEKD